MTLDALAFMLRKNQVEVAFQVDFDLCRTCHFILRKNQVEVDLRFTLTSARVRQDVWMKGMKKAR